jgi:protein-tyrosine-phosphatase
MSGDHPKRLAFVCTGNICRSPMAAGIASSYALERGWPIEVLSGGVLGIIGKPADPLAIKVMEEVGIDIRNHRSGDIDAVADWADHILVMELGHGQRIRERFPDAADKVLMLGNFGGAMEIRDPIGGWRWRFRECRDTLFRCVRGFMDQLPPQVR